MKCLNENNYTVLILKISLICLPPVELKSLGVLVALSEVSSVGFAKIYRCCQWMSLWPHIYSPAVPNRV